MTVRIGRSTMWPDGNFSFTIAKASNRGDDYVRAVVAGLKEHEVPVDRRLDAVKGNGVDLREALILTPTERRLRKTYMVHYAKAVGASLQVGYLVCPGDAFPAEGTIRGDWGLTGPREADVDNYVNLVLLIRDFCVAPAIETIAGQPMSGPAGGSGFFGS